MQIFFMSSSDIIFLSAVQQQWRHMLPRLLSYVHGNTSMFWSFTLYSFSVTTESKSFLFMCNKFLGCHQTLTWKFYPHNMGGKGEGRGVLSTRKDIHLITGTIVRREVIVSWSTDAVSTVGGRWTRFSQRCAAVAMVVEEEKQRERERERACNSTTQLPPRPSCIWWFTRSTGNAPAALPSALLSSITLFYITVDYKYRPRR